MKHGIYSILSIVLLDTLSIHSSVHVHRDTSESCNRNSSTKLPLLLFSFRETTRIIRFIRVIHSLTHLTIYSVHQTHKVKNTSEKTEVITSKHLHFGSYPITSSTVLCSPLPFLLIPISSSSPVPCHIYRIQYIQSHITLEIRVGSLFTPDSSIHPFIHYLQSSFIFRLSSFVFHCSTMPLSEIHPSEMRCFDLFRNTVSTKLKAQTTNRQSRQ